MHTRWLGNCIVWLGGGLLVCCAITVLLVLLRVPASHQAASVPAVEDRAGIERYRPGNALTVRGRLVYSTYGFAGWLGAADELERDCEPLISLKLKDGSHVDCSCESVPRKKYDSWKDRTALESALTIRGVVLDKGRPTPILGRCSLVPNALE